MSCRSSSCLHFLWWEDLVKRGPSEDQISPQPQIKRSLSFPTTRCIFLFSLYKSNLQPKRRNGNVPCAHSTRLCFERSNLITYEWIVCVEQAIIRLFFCQNNCALACSLLITEPPAQFSRCCPPFTALISRSNAGFESLHRVDWVELVKRGLQLLTKAEISRYCAYLTPRWPPLIMPTNWSGPDID